MKNYFLLSNNHKWLSLDNGTMFRKQIVKFGDWANPENPKQVMKLDKSWAEKIKANFDNGTVGRVPVPVSHTNLASLNSGEVISLSVEKDGLYATLDIRNAETSLQIEEGTIWDVSVAFDNEYVDKKSGKVAGPTLLHVALVNNPYLKGMKPFQALSEAFGLNNKTNAIMLSERDFEMLIKVKNDKDFDITVKYTENGEEKELVLKAGEEVEVEQEIADAITPQIADAVAPVEKTDEEKAAEAKAEEEKKVADEAEAKKAEEEKANAENHVDNAGEGEGAKTDGEGELADKGTVKCADCSGTGKLADGAKCTTCDGSGMVAPAKKEMSNEEKLEKELSEAKKELARRDAETQFSDLLKDKKVVPAQKDLFMKLSEQNVTSVIALDDKTEKSVSAVVSELLRQGPAKFSLDEKGTINGNKDDAPETNLSDADKAGMKALGVSEEDYAEVAKENPQIVK